MFSYIFKNKTHTDTSTVYMGQLGMDEEQQQAVNNQKAFEMQQIAQKRKAAFEAVSDPLYFDWQYELATGNPDEKKFLQKWLDAKAAIILKFPKPSEPVA